MEALGYAVVAFGILAFGLVSARAERSMTEMMVKALQKKGLPVSYFLFDGEQHGFRGAETIKRTLDAELYFYAALLLKKGLRF